MVAFGGEAVPGVPNVDHIRECIVCQFTTRAGDGDTVSSARGEGAALRGASSAYQTRQYCQKARCEQQEPPMGQGVDDRAGAVPVVGCFIRRDLCCWLPVVPQCVASLARCDR